MAQQQWNYYVPPTNTSSNVNTIVDSVRNAVKRNDLRQQQEKAIAEKRAKETKREAENNRIRNDKQLDNQQTSMAGYTNEIAENAGGDGYKASILNKTYTMEDKKAFAEISRKIETKECGACTEEIAKRSMMMAEPGITKDFVTDIELEFSEMDDDIAKGVFDTMNNSTLLAIRGVLQGKGNAREYHSYGIRRLEDGTQEFWITGPDVNPNKGEEYVINSNQLSKAAANGGGIYASPYDQKRELEAIDNSFRIVKDADKGTFGDYQEKFLNPKKEYEVDPKDPSVLIEYQTRNTKLADEEIKRAVTAQVAGDFSEENIGSAIATWNTKLAKDEDEKWEYWEWENLPDNNDFGGYTPSKETGLKDRDTKQDRRQLYQERLTEKFKKEQFVNFDIPVPTGTKIPNPNYVEGSNAPTQTIFEDMSKDLSSAFTQAFPYENDNIEINGDKITTTIEGEKGDDGEIGELKEVTYDMTKKKDYVTFYEFLAKNRGNFDGTSDANKAARETFRNKVKAEWEKEEAKRKEDAKKAAIARKQLLALEKKNSFDFSTAQQNNIGPEIE